jgi:hypothetical protein
MSIMNSQKQIIEEQSYATKNKEVNNYNIYIDDELYDCEPDESDMNEIFDERDYEQYLEERRQSELYAVIELIGNLEMVLSESIQAKKILQTKSHTLIDDIGESQYQNILDIISFFILEKKQRLLEAWKQYESLNG